jgi:GntR family transcriptional regulator, transcriptional repressor for pyruvate dehydrogenase complex
MSVKRTDWALRPIQRPRLYEELAARLRAHIQESELAPGDRLPSERELAERLGVSRVTVKQAIVALEVQGVLDVRHGGGIYLRRREVGEPLQRLLERRLRLPETLEARETLECKLAELAALRRTNRDLEAMDRALVEMERDITRGGIGAQQDADFHRAITLAARNVVLAKLMEGLAEKIHETRIESLSEPGRPPRSLAAHRKIIEAIRRSDPDASGAAMREHLKVVADVRLMRWKPEE